MSDFAIEDYNDSNRAFVQAFMARGVLTYESAKPLLAAILTVHEDKEVVPNDVTLEDFASYISKANVGLTPLDLEILSTFHQTTRERIYALVNTTSDPLTQLATTYSADELAFVKRLLDAMFDGAANTKRKEAMCLSTMDAIHLGRGGPRRETQNGTSQAANSTMKMDDAEKMLEKLNNEGWLEKSKAGFHTLSPRALMELKGWLVETYNDPVEDGDEEGRQNKIKSCHACREIITMVCPSRSSARDCLAYTKFRANVVRTENVHVDSTISVLRISFECSVRRLVQFARSNGMGNIMWARRLSPRPTAIQKGREGLRTKAHLERLMMANRKIPDTSSESEKVYGMQEGHPLRRPQHLKTCLNSGRVQSASGKYSPARPGSRAVNWHAGTESSPCSYEDGCSRVKNLRGIVGLTKLRASEPVSLAMPAEPNSGMTSTTSS